MESRCHLDTGSLFLLIQCLTSLAYQRLPPEPPSVGILTARGKSFRAITRDCTEEVLRRM